MTVNELIQKVDEFYDETIATEDAINWVNECQQVDLMENALILTSTSVKVDANTWADLPSDFLKIRYIELDGDKYTGQVEYMDKKVKFPYAGTYTIYYYRMAATVTSVNDTPEAHTALHLPMVHYIAAKQYFNDSGPENIKGKNAMNEYVLLRDSVLRGLKRGATVGQVSGVIR